MTYQVTYRADAWVRAEGGLPEWRQVVTTSLDDGTYLVVVIARAASGSAPRVADARIEQPYITRTEGRRCGSSMPAARPAPRSRRVWGCRAKRSVAG